LSNEKKKVQVDPEASVNRGTSLPRHLPASFSKELKKLDERLLESTDEDDSLSPSYSPVFPWRTQISSGFVFTGRVFVTPLRVLVTVGGRTSREMTGDVG
jgi:hypothetical protein